MDNRKIRGDRLDLLGHLGNSSKNMILHHQRDNLSEFVLHDLCSAEGFKIRKAAYLINNPDFSCLKGVAGYYQPEIFDGVSWLRPKDFSSHMQKAPFNQRVRSFVNGSLPSISSQALSMQQLHDIIDFLEIEDAGYHSWQSKHNNQGLFIFERPQDMEELNDHLHNFLHMLSFCPIF